MEIRKGYTIESLSDDGWFFLCKGWGHRRMIWFTFDELKNEHLFDSPKDAKASLTKLLKVMPEYKEDEFRVMEFIRNPLKPVFIRSEKVVID